MVRRIFTVAVLLALLGESAAAAELPCVAAARELRAEAVEVPNSFWDCTGTSRVCVALFYPSVDVVRANSVRELPNNGSANFGIVQSNAGDEPALCLVGAFSGGSAAAWIFQGWKIEGGRPVPLRGMEKSRMNSDAVPPRALANAIYGAYWRSRK